jgi:hypothetical protein
MRSRGFALVLALVTCLSQLPDEAVAADTWRHYTETGFMVADSDDGQFLSEFTRFGGVSALGYPVSQPYEGPGGLSINSSSVAPSSGGPTRTEPNSAT